MICLTGPQPVPIKNSQLTPKCGLEKKTRKKSYEESYDKNIQPIINKMIMAFHSNTPTAIPFAAAVPARPTKCPEPIQCSAVCDDIEGSVKLCKSQCLRELTPVLPLVIKFILFA